VVDHFKFLSIRTAEVSPAASRSLSPILLPGPWACFVSSPASRTIVASIAPITDPTSAPLLQQFHLVLQFLQLPFQLHHVELGTFFLHAGLLLRILHLVQLLLQPVDFCIVLLLLPLVVGAGGDQPLLGGVLLLDRVLQPLVLVLRLLHVLLRGDHVLLGLPVLVLPSLHLLLQALQLGLVNSLALVRPLVLDLSLAQLLLCLLHVHLDPGEGGLRVLDLLFGLLVFLSQLLVFPGHDL